VEWLRGEHVALRPLDESDLDRVLEILDHAEVAPWWPSHGPERLREDLFGDDCGVVPYAVEAEGQVVGVIEYWEETDPDYRHAGIDIALHPDWHGRGLGADAVRVLARHLFDTVGHHRVVIDPAAANHRAVAAYRRVGFRPVGVMRRYERAPDGGWRDGLLLDLLPEDLDASG
jgi:aminoglycoside 6'-N-acetyltransferase